MDALTIETGLLVLITGYYAWQTAAYVEELRVDRRGRIEPHLVPLYAADEHFPSQGHIYVLNAGPGIALEIDAVLSLEPGGMRTQLRCAALQVGERRAWMPSLGSNPSRQPTPFYPDAQINRTHVRLRGRCRDTSGSWHDVDQQTLLRDEWKVILDLGPETEEALRALESERGEPTESASEASGPASRP